MSYSYYEVYTNTQRAFSGLGFTYGSDEDAAFITTWLEVFGFDGIKLLTFKIEELDNTFNASIDPSKINQTFICRFPRVSTGFYTTAIDLYSIFGHMSQDLRIVRPPGRVWRKIMILRLAFDFQLFEIRFV